MNERDGEGKRKRKRKRGRGRDLFFDELECVVKQGLINKNHKN